MNVLIRKQALRQEIRKARQHISLADAAAAAHAVVDRIRLIPEVTMASTVHSYLPAPDLHEIDILPLLVELAGKGVRVMAPIVDHVAADPGRPRLAHGTFRPGGDLRINQWGIPEPVDRSSPDLNSLDVVIVPALACDRKGYRLGFGHGYYDEFLASVDAVTICPCLDRFLHPSLPREEHDRRVDIIVTESMVLRSAA